MARKPSPARSLAIAEELAEECDRDLRAAASPEDLATARAASVAAVKGLLAGDASFSAYSIRAALSPGDANGCLRDPVVYRGNTETPHHRTGRTHKAYPTYDFACPFVDSVEGVTHALRTSEYKDREAQYYRMLSLMRRVRPDLREVHIWDYAKLQMIGTILSKRKLQWLIDAGRASGWDDPRFPTVRGLARRGMRMEALREFVVSQGASRNVTYQEWDKIWTLNKRLIDPIAPRHTAVGGGGVSGGGGGSVLLELDPASPGCPGPEGEAVTVPAHPKNAEVGSKCQHRQRNLVVDAEDAAFLAASLAERRAAGADAPPLSTLREGDSLPAEATFDYGNGYEFTLMGWGNAVVTAVEVDAATGAPTLVRAALRTGGDFKKTKLKATWLPADNNLTVPIEMRRLHPLLIKDKPDDDDDIAAISTPPPGFDAAFARGDGSMRRLSRGDVIQVERRGFYIVDRALGEPGAEEEDRVVLVDVPDGRGMAKSGVGASK